MQIKQINHIWIVAYVLMFRLKFDVFTLLDILLLVEECIVVIGDGVSFFWSPLNKCSPLADIPFYLLPFRLVLGYSSFNLTQWVTDLLIFLKRLSY
jgi:hypothetical protein